MKKTNLQWHLVRDEKGDFWMYNVLTKELITEEELNKRNLTNK